MLCPWTFGGWHASITIRDNVTLAFGVTIVTATHDLGDGAARAFTPRSEPVRIESGCWVGARATIMPGVTIGQGCIIAAGALVAANCAPDGLYAGVPARRIRDL
jgi:maltose O-acetyltransferase